MTNIIKNGLDRLNYFVGNVEIHPEQFYCAQNIMKIFEDEEGPPVLIAQMQQGKTGVTIRVIYEFKERMDRNNQTYEIIYLINISDNEIREQTKARMRQAGLEKYVKTFHLTNINTYNKINVDKRLIIIDECHFAIEKDKTFENFLNKNFDISYGNTRASDWTDKNTYILSVSATPYAHIARNEIRELEKCFTPVALSVSDDYYSLHHLAGKVEGFENRLYPSKPVVKNSKTTDFFIEKMEDFLKICEKKSNGNWKNPGFLVVRSSGHDANIIKKDIERLYPEIPVDNYDRANKNLAALDSRLKEENPIPSVIIIKNALRAGKTLTTTKNIRMWIDPPHSKTDTLTQSIGRSLGFEKCNDKYPIYCNAGKELENIETAIDFYNYFKCAPKTILETNKNNKVFKAPIPSGINTKSSVKNKDYFGPMFFFTRDEAVVFGIKETGSEEYKENYVWTNIWENKNEDKETNLLLDIINKRPRNFDKSKMFQVVHIGNVKNIKETYLKDPEKLKKWYDTLLETFETPEGKYITNMFAVYYRTSKYRHNGRINKDIFTKPTIFNK